LVTFFTPKKRERTNTNLGKDFLRPQKRIFLVRPNGFVGEKKSNSGNEKKRIKTTGQNETALALFLEKNLFNAKKYGLKNYTKNNCLHELFITKRNPYHCHFRKIRFREKAFIQ